MLDELGRISAAMAASPDGAIRVTATVLKIRDRRGRIRALRANAAQRAFEHGCGQQNVVLKARQMGMTTWIAGRFFLRTALQPGTSSLLVAHNRESAEAIFAMVRRMWELLPADVRGSQMALRRSNVGEIVFAAGSEFRVASAADANAGRGLSVQNLHCSEVSRWPGDAAATLAGLRAALAPEGELVLESTPSGAYGPFYAAWHEAVEPGTGADTGQMVRHFFPWWMEPSYVGAEIAAEQRTDEERQLVECHGLSAAQIGFRRGLQRSFGALRAQEFVEDAESCFRATGACCFAIEVLEKRIEAVPEPISRGRGGALLRWLPGLPGRTYVMGVDTAGGGSEGDFAAVQVVDAETGVQCAELHERLRPAELVEACYALVAEYPGSWVAVERNNHGAAVLALMEQKGGLRLYRQGGQTGWLTSAVSKPEMVARLRKLLDDRPELFASRRFFSECRSFAADERGRMGAAAGAHDDLVMAMGVAQGVRAEWLLRGLPG